MQLCLQKTMKSTKLTHDIDIMAPSYDTMLHNLIELKCNSFEKWIEAQQSIAVNPESSKYKLLDLQIRHAMTTFIDVPLLAILYKHLTECSTYDTMLHNTVELSTFCEAVVNIEFDFILKFRQDIMSHDMSLGAHLDNHIDALRQFVMCMYNKSKGAATTIVQHYIVSETISQLVLYDSRHQMIESMIAQLDKFDLLNVQYAIIKQLETKVSCNTAMLTRFVDDAIKFEICNTASDAFKFAVKLMCTRLNKALLDVNKALLDDNSSRPLRKVAVEHMMQLVQQSLQSSMYNLHDVKQIEASCTLIVYNALLVNFQQQN